MTTRDMQASGSTYGSALSQASVNLVQAAFGRASLLLPPPRAITPGAIVVAPEPMRDGNPDKGREIYRGRYTLAGETITTGAVLPYECVASRAWHEQLHAFGWLADLQAGGSELQRAQARSLLGDWIKTRDGHHPTAWQMGTTARRLLNLLYTSAFLLEKAGDQFEDVFFVSVGRHIRWIQRRLPFAPASRGKLDAAIALSYASVCLDTGPKFRDMAFQALSRELSNQILTDGGHISRNGQTLVDVLLDLVPLAEIIEHQGIEFPAHLCNSIDRAVPMARMLCHGDGGLAAFNGVGSAMRGAIRAILNHDEIGGKPVAYASYSGYSRLNHKRTIVIVDWGVPPAPPFAAQAHASTLAFELSEGLQRIVVSCGEPPPHMREWGKHVRATAAHSTACLADRSSIRFFENGLVRKLLGGPVHWGLRDVNCAVDRHEGGTLMTASHDGYVRSNGLLHERALWLSPDGLNLRGEDNFAPVSEAPRNLNHQSYTIRFHLHPSVKATLSQDQNSAMLLLPDRTGWRFSAKGARLSLEDSVYLVDRPNPQKTLQIVLSGYAAEGHKVLWAFKKVEKQVKNQLDLQAAPELPL
ncbi:MAG: heparinase [Rhizobiales bacterium]|nr:heparinase [Hyphomicrobiales bacterium]